MEKSGSNEIIKVLKLDCHDFSSLFKVRLFGARSVKDQTRITLYKLWNTGYIAHARRLDIWGRNKQTTQHPTKVRQFVLFGDYSTPFTLYTEVTTKCNSLIYQMYSVACRIIVPKYGPADRAEEFDLRNYRADMVANVHPDECVTHEIEFLFLADDGIDLGTAGILAAMNEVFIYTKDLTDEIVFIEDNSSKDNKSRFRMHGLLKFQEFNDYRDKLVVLNTPSDHSGNRGDSSHWTNRVAMNKALARKLEQNRVFQAPTTAAELVEFCNTYIGTPEGEYRESQIKKRLYFELNESVVEKFRSETTLFEFGGSSTSAKIEGISRCQRFTFKEGTLNGYFDITSTHPFLICKAL